MDLGKSHTKPCLVQARQGFSVLYQNRYLYSQYDPERPLNRLIDSLTILPETLILAYSPVLGLGLERLLERLPESCSVLALEFDEALWTLFLASDAAQRLEGNPRFSAALLSRPEDIARLLTKPADKLRPEPARAAQAAEAGPAFFGADIPPEGSYRRCLTVEMSGGVQLYQEAYRLTTRFADDCTGRFWKNRLTLTRMGQLYASNLLRNIGAIPSAHPLTKGSVTKPVFVIGAGPSTDELLLLPEADKAFIRQHFFLLSVDAALPALLEADIRPDAVVAVESQLAIEKAYIGAAGSGIPVIADLSSRARVLSITEGPVSFFLTEYCTEPFMKRFAHLAAQSGIPVFQPLGSVGLTALDAALFLRAPATPIYFIGLDFSYPAGMTHCKGAPASLARLFTADRLTAAGNPAAAFSQGASCITGKDGETWYTTPNLLSYGMLLAERYRAVQLLFDAGQTGLMTGLPRTSLQKMLQDAKNGTIAASYVKNNDYICFSENNAPETQILCSSFMAAEEESLKRISALIRERLTGCDAADTEHAAGSDEGRNELAALLTEHSYLYLHFPDAARGLRMDMSFLARIQAVIPHFLKKLSQQLHEQHIPSSF